MNRLTEKIKEGFYITPNINSTDDLKYKLGQLEDIEEELGIELITLFRALKGEIYSLHSTTRKICPIILPIFYYCGNQWVIGCHSMEWNAEENSCDNWDCFLKDYGKTWALTREELEK